MKTKKNRINNFLKFGIFLFGISLLLWNCEKEENFEPDDFMSNHFLYKTISPDELLKFKNDNKYSKKSNEKLNLQINFSKIEQKNIKNTSEFTTVISAKTKHKNIHTKVILIKYNDSIIKVLINMIPHNDPTSERFSGIMSMTHLNGKFINAYRLKNGLFLSQFVKTPKNKTMLYRDAEPEGDDCDEALDPSSIFCDDTLDEIVITSSNGSSSNYTVTIPPGPTPTDYSNYVFGSGTGGGGSSSLPNGGEGVDVFPCDDPIHGCDKKETEEDKIDSSNLTGKAGCVFKKLDSLSNGFKNIIKKFDGDFPVSHLKYSIDNSLSSGVNAVTDNSGQYLIEIRLNGNTLSQRTVLGLARTLIHETIHAEMYRKLRSVNYSVSINDFPGIYDYYRRHKNWQHQQMSQHYVGKIAEMLKEFDKNQSSDQLYSDLAWEGLQNTVAWNNLSNSERTRIINSVNNYKNTGNTNCN